MSIAFSAETPGRQSNRPNEARVLEDGSFALPDYDARPPFASFLPGIAGKHGVPMWCFYVNRAQAVVSFGIEDKNHAILEYLPANWAYQLVALQGFRTFCLIDGGFYEPFQLPAAQSDHERRMVIDLASLSISERDKSRRLRFHVRYTTPVGLRAGCLLRELTISNEAKTPRHVGVLDGIPVIVPGGLSDQQLKSARHISQAYAVAESVGSNIACFSSKVQAHDQAEVTGVAERSFYSAWAHGDSSFQELGVVTDPDLVFGCGNDFRKPYEFISTGGESICGGVGENRLPCAFATLQATIPPGSAITVFSLIGQTRSAADLAAVYEAVESPHSFAAMKERTYKEVEEICVSSSTVSSQTTLDYYTRQTFLDNVIRGGMPLMFQSQQGPTPHYIYSRLHGDLERDYNHFRIPAQPLSSGHGNYRDVCQNRRNNVWFFPEVFDADLRLFVGLLQPDGFNPLSVFDYRWKLADSFNPEDVFPLPSADATRSFRRLVTRRFSPGDLIAWAFEHDQPCATDSDWLRGVLSKCDRFVESEDDAGGYWIDHWTYVADMLESFAALYPDKVRAVLSEQEDIGWHLSNQAVCSRAKKYVRREFGMRQLGAVENCIPEGMPFPKVSLLSKLAALASIKAISFDPECCGIEMEAGRPGWNDAMNGLPALFGSSTCETAELARLARLLSSLGKPLPAVRLPIEVFELMQYVAESVESDTYCWSRACQIRERFRRIVLTGASGECATMPGEDLGRLLRGIERRAVRALRKAKVRDSELVHTYYMRETAPMDAQWMRVGKTPHQEAQGNGRTQTPLPLFLEGQVHLLRVLDCSQSARRIHAAVRSSELFDRDLSMYKLNADLSSVDPAIGRARTFTRGWLENESIWLHMSYKYLLELLKHELYTEFFKDAETMLVPFMDPEKYGRSILENSSFIASSAYPDASAHGRGYYGRLSGSTAEYLSMWLHLTLGSTPFAVDNKEVVLSLQPVLPGEWFTASPSQVKWQGEMVSIPENAFACAFLGSVLLVYHNPERTNTFGANGVRTCRYDIDGKVQVEGSVVRGRIAESIRNGELSRLDVWLSSPNAVGTE